MEKEINNLIIRDEVSNKEIKNLIYTIRGKQVMLDSDVAMLYNYETKKINQAVKRNIDRFPERFCFKLTKTEFDLLRSQIETLNRNIIYKGSDKSFLRSQIVTSKIENYDKVEKRGGRRDLPYVFTEQGIAMLSGILKNEIAIQVSINIMEKEIKNILYKNIDNYVKYIYNCIVINYLLPLKNEKFEGTILRKIKRRKMYGKGIFNNNRW